MRTKCKYVSKDYEELLMKMVNKKVSLMKYSEMEIIDKFKLDRDDEENEGNEEKKEEESWLESEEDNNIIKRRISSKKILSRSINKFGSYSP